MEELTSGIGFCLDVGDEGPPGGCVQALNDLCDQAEAKPGVAVVVLRIGGDKPRTGAWPGTAGTHDMNRWERAVRRLERLSAVSVAVARGTSCGPALDLLLAADYRIATADLRIVLPVNNGQFWPGMVMHRLVHQVGGAHARQLVLWGHDIPGKRALELGLVDEITTDVDQAVSAAAVMLGREAGHDKAMRRQLLLEASHTSFEEALGVHLAACDRELRRLAAAAPSLDEMADASDGASAQEVR
ncbi:enoyl-CoA-hydratase DpgB [Streptomyces sp. ALI-76-A]|uniref:enoyl-CoA-hydratase DpgB n=1 Tax=Streptomyces sp. ALI-76-A TaxID=3025736 RepID=UPI00256EC967|nr:enoyl-CoA-hydratase DpgB [Streptomyces sp. ALI-76-A]MDL5199793.1 enoyl-CoA hydratase/isomerase family protein [Streptomyces sp. ALI-76-A]